MRNTIFFNHFPLSMTTNKVYFKRTSLTTRNSGPKFCVRTMLTGRRAAFQKTTSSLRLEPIRHSMKIKPEMSQPPRRTMAYLSQLERLSSKTNTRLGIEQDMTKNPFGTKNAKPGDPKNHMCLTDTRFNISRTLTSSQGLKGKVKEFHEMVAPGPISIAKRTKKMKKLESKGLKENKGFKQKPQYLYQGYLKSGTIIRHSFTKKQLLKLHIGNLRIASKMLRLKTRKSNLLSTSPRFFT